MNFSDRICKGACLETASGLWTSFAAFHLAYIEAIPEARRWDDGGFGLIRAVLILCVKLKEILLEEHRKKDTNS